jgi:hypothetical protein
MHWTWIIHAAAVPVVLCCAVLCCAVMELTAQAAVQALQACPGSGWWTCTDSMAGYDVGEIE